MAWQPNEQVTFVSHSGERSVRELDEVTIEGFAIVRIGAEDEIVFTPTGRVINHLEDPTTKGPRIHKLKGQTYTKGSFNDPWHNEFALQTFTINELKQMLEILIEDKKGNEKLNLNSYKSSVTIKEMFSKKKPKNKFKKPYRKRING